MASVEKTLNALEKQRQALVDAYVQSAWKMFKSMSPADWWNDAVTQGVSAYVVQKQMAFVKAMRRLGISYADIMLGLVNKPVSGEIPEYIVTRNNTDPWAVALRPVNAYRHLAVADPSIAPLAWDNLADDVQRAVDSWFDAALEQLQDNADTDGQIGVTRAALERFSGSGVTKFRRVIHPELSKTGTCGLCVVASDRLYNVGDLLPLHSNCKCGVVPVTERSDPGSGLSQSDLDKVYKKAWDALSDKRRQKLIDLGQSYTTYGKDLMKVSVRYKTDSEIGPVLERDEGTLNTVPSRGSEEWKTPDRKMTENQLKRMYDRALAFEPMYQQVYDTGKPVSFRYDGRTYTFKPSNHLNQAWVFHRSLISNLRVSLGMAA